MRFSPPLDDDNAELAGVLAVAAVTVEQPTDPARHRSRSVPGSSRPPGS
jgi:hypothetical protein